MEREERKQIAALGLNPQERVFTAEEVRVVWPSLPPSAINVCFLFSQLASKLVMDRRKFQLGVCEVSESMGGREGGREG